MHRVFIGLGSNLEHPRQQVSDALRELAALEGCHQLKHSRLYRSDPVGPPGQPDYINAVAELWTEHSPEVLLDQLQAIEQDHERVRIEHWGPRTLDLDILLYDQQIIKTKRLLVPHPFLKQRSFVLYPLAELDPDIRLPTGETLTQLLSECPMGTLEAIAL